MKCWTVFFPHTTDCCVSHIAWVSFLWSCSPVVFLCCSTLPVLLFFFPQTTDCCVSHIVWVYCSHGHVHLWCFYVAAKCMYSVLLSQPWSIDTSTSTVWPTHLPCFISDAWIVDPKGWPLGPSWLNWSLSIKRRPVLLDSQPLKLSSRSSEV